MAMKLQFGEAEYRIVGDVKEGELFPYGEVAELEEAGIKYLALASMSPDGDVESMLPGDAWLVSYRSAAATTEDVDFEGPEGGADEVDDADEDDEEEVEVVAAADEEDDADDDDDDEEDGKGKE